MAIIFYHIAIRLCYYSVKQIRVSLRVIFIYPRAIHSPDGSHMSSLFRPTSSRFGTDAQAVTLIHLGLSHPTLVSIPYGPRFVTTFIQLQNCDELGFLIGGGVVTPDSRGSQSPCVSM